jgi:hypothetical protein
MKKIMCRLSNHYHCSTIKHLGRLLAVFLVVAVATPVLLAENNDRDQGRFVDPFVGSWLVHATVDHAAPGIPVPFEFDALQANFEDGTVIATVIAGAPAHGVWKRSGPPRTYDVKFLYFPSGPQYPPGTIGTGLPGPLMLNPQGTQLTGPFHGFNTGPDGKVIDTVSGTVVIDRISFTSNP